MSDLIPFFVTLVVFGVVAAGLAVATITWLAVESARTPRTRPVVLVTTERGATRAAA